jgi:RNA-directed DNA polymerase
VQRTGLAKADGRQRPLGMPAFEDTIVQRAVPMVLGAIAAPDGHDFSPGFRDGHSPHQALQEWREQGRDVNRGWSVEADVRGCFARLAPGL